MYSLLVESAQFLDQVSLRNGKSRIRGKSITYMELCQIICRVRNRFIGHGSMVYAISKEFVFHILIVGKVLIQRYYETFSPLESLTISLKKGNPPIMKKYKKKIFYYNATLDKDYYRYLNYESGQLITYYLPSDTVISAIYLQSNYELEEDNVYE